MCWDRIIEIEETVPTRTSAARPTPVPLPQPEPEDVPELVGAES